ncbi:predicted protein [Micromonas commoda]|uniref:Uncharacterized protein n=1 Tax=Micromonas commoda (strain RCC299 / NOUM17 / CCMP2709) TaxID=296587 RepID=C1FF32_MICCC|nr:predicted protein [Micromonas commoda]ACO68290.1 predicted protein [Micromonas commoda]|eukprot:XP_002507032.1 predicted protein [Micromonas commoda]
MPGDLRLSPSLTPSKVYHDPDRSSARKKAPPGTHARRQLDLGEDAKNNNDARRVRVPGPPRGRVFDQGPERPGSDDPPWARRLRLKLRDVRAMADEDIDDDDDDDDDDEPISAAMGAEGDGPTSRRAPTMRLRGNLEDILALYEPGNEKPEGFEVSITSPRSAVACLKAKCDPNSLVPRPEPVFAPQNQKNVCARRRKEQRARLTALLARRDAMDDPREVARMARELSGAAQAEAKFKEKENERQRRRDDVDERVLAALAKAELEAATLMDDLNDIASAADHEELARFGEAARERERIAAKDAARSRNLHGRSPVRTPSSPPSRTFVAASPATPRRTTPGRDKADFLASAPRVAFDASSILADRADIERRTMEALERERADAERATAKRTEALERKRADLRRVEEAVRASVERRREEERKYYNAMRARTEARTEEEIAVAEKELKAEEARVRATNEAREASFEGTRGGGTRDTDVAARGGRTVDSSAPGIEPATSAIDPAPSSPVGHHARPVSAPPRGVTTPAHVAAHPTPSVRGSIDRTSSSSVTVSNGHTERAARRAAFADAEADERASYEAAAAELARQKIARARLQRDADALVRQERRVAEKQRRADGVARRKEWNAKAESADREACRVRVQMRLDAARKKKEAIDEEHASALAMRGAEREERREVAALQRARARAADAEWRASIARERHVKICATSEKLDRRLRLESARVAAELARDEEAFLAKIASRAERIGVEADGVMARAFDVEARAEEEAYRREASAGRMHFEHSGAFATSLGDDGRVVSSPVGAKKVYDASLDGSTHGLDVFVATPGVVRGPGALFSYEPGSSETGE